LVNKDANFKDYARGKLKYFVWLEVFNKNLDFFLNLNLNFGLTYSCDQGTKIGIP
jgi:hypothetical protein